MMTKFSPIFAYTTSTAHKHQYHSGYYETATKNDGYPSPKTDLLNEPPDPALSIETR